jgi:hypothetical protein
VLYYVLGAEYGTVIMYSVLVHAFRSTGQYSIVRSTTILRIVLLRYSNNSVGKLGLHMTPRIRDGGGLYSSQCTSLQLRVHFKTQDHFQLFVSTAAAVIGRLDGRSKCLLRYDLIEEQRRRALMATE